MKLAVSNIAWPKEADAVIAKVLNEVGISGIEIAPTKVWPNPLAAPEAQVDDYRKFWGDRGIAIVAAQALLFGKPELTIFESAATREATLEYLKCIVTFCARLGARSLVFGSPKNRRIGSMSPGEAHVVAVEFFARLGEFAASAGTCVVLEANPPEYGADFVTRTADAIDLVQAVNRPGFRLHLDTGCMTLAGDPIIETLRKALPAHFHVSEPNLDPPGTSGKVDHVAFAGALRQREYRGWVSLEMRERNPLSLDAFVDCVRWLKATYNGFRMTAG